MSRWLGIQLDTWLKKAERKFRIDFRYIVKGSFWLFLANGISIAAGLALAVAFANWVSPRTFGNYQFILSLIGIIGAFTLTGMETAVKQAASRGVKNVLRYGFFVRLKWSVGIFLASGIGAIYYYLNDNNTLALSLLIAGSLSPFLDSAKLYNSYLLGTKQFKRSALLGFTRKLIPTALMLTTLWFTDDPVLLVLMFFASNTLVMLSLFFTSLKEEPETKTHTEDTVHDMVNYSKHLSVMNFFGSLAGNLDKILIFHFLGAAPLAAYAFASMPVSKMKLVPNTLKGLLLPKLSVQSTDSLKQTLPKKILIATLLMSIVVASYILLAPYIFDILFPQYVDAVLFSQFLVLTLLLSIPNTFFGQLLVAHAKKKELYVSKMLGPIIRILLFLVLLPTFGIWGAVASILITKLFMFGVLLTQFRRL